MTSEKISSRFLSLQRRYQDDYVHIDARSIFLEWVYFQAHTERKETASVYISLETIDRLANEFRWCLFDDLANLRRVRDVLEAEGFRVKDRFVGGKLGAVEALGLPEGSFSH